MKKRSDKLRRNIDILAWNTFLAELRLYYPVAVLAFQAAAGSFAEAMSVFAVRETSQALLEVPTGVLSDKMGRRLTFVFGSLAELVGVSFYALAFFTPYPLWFLYAGAALFGFAGALFSGNNDALIYETLSAYRRAGDTAKMIGRVSSMGQLGLAASGVLASLCLLLGLSYRDLMVFSVFPIFLSFLLSLFMIEPPRHKAEEERSLAHMKQALKLIVKNPRLRWLAIAGAVKHGLGNATHSFTPGFIDSVRPAWLTPLYRSAQNGLGAVSFWFAGRVAKRFGLMRSLFGATAYSYLAAGISFATATFFSPFLLLTTQFSYAVGLTADGALKQENFSKAQRSTMGSLIAFAGSLVSGAGAVLTGVLADYFGPADSLLILLLITLPTALIYFRLYKAER